jgi:hypothetical protein
MVTGTEDRQLPAEGQGSYRLALSWLTPMGSSAEALPGPVVSEVARAVALLINVDARSASGTGGPAERYHEAQYRQDQRDRRPEEALPVAV